MKDTNFCNRAVLLYFLCIGFLAACPFASGCASRKDAFKGTPVPVVTQKGLDAGGAETLRGLRKDPTIEAFISQRGIPNYLIKKEDRLFLVYTQTNVMYAFEKSLLGRTYKLLYVKAIPSDIRSALPLEEQTAIEKSLPLYRASP